MTVDQINRLILFTFLGISLFILLETYVLPLDTSKGIVITKTERSLSRVRLAIFRVQTEKNTITVPPLAYNGIMENDTIEISRSFITHSIQKVSVYRKGGAYTWRIGFVSLGGLDFLILIIVSHILYLAILYKKINSVKKRRDITIFLSCISIVFLLFYFLFE